MKRPKLQKKPRFRSKVSRAIFLLARDLCSCGMLPQEELAGIRERLLKPDGPRIKNLRGGARVHP
jgi:hypothetical protein